MKNDNLDLVNIYAYIEFGQILSICSQDIKWKRNYDGRTDALTVGYFLGTYSVRKVAKEA